MNFYGTNFIPNNPIGKGLNFSGDLLKSRYVHGRSALQADKKRVGQRLIQAKSIGMNEKSKKKLLPANNVRNKNY
ncbi:MAG: hypothetical protein CMB64_04750 [Euryarchaeota archaeon]|nr:hypothetical protein [Euryarchaeota archaeon]|tara:strand:- start:761 stop:985 length:225 start_codon:yes stop_codon:yes gene_type:complete